MLTDKNIKWIHDYVADAIGDDEVYEHMASEGELWEFLSIVNKNHNAAIEPSQVVFGCGKIGGNIYRLHIFVLLTNEKLYFESNVDCDRMQEFELDKISNVKTNGELIQFSCGSKNVLLDMGEDGEFIGAYIEAIGELNSTRNRVNKATVFETIVEASPEEVASNKPKEIEEPRLLTYEKSTPEIEAEIERAMRMFDEGKVEEAISIIKPFASRGIVDACCKMAYIHQVTALSMEDLNKAGKYYIHVVDAPKNVLPDGRELLRIRMELSKALLIGSMPQYGKNPASALKLLMMCARQDSEFYLTIVRFMESMLIPHESVFDVFYFLDKYRASFDSLFDCFKVLRCELSPDLLERYFLYIIHLGREGEVSIEDIMRICKICPSLDLRNIEVSSLEVAGFVDEGAVLSVTDSSDLEDEDNIPGGRHCVGPRYTTDNGYSELVIGDEITEIHMEGSTSIFITPEGGEYNAQENEYGLIDEITFYSSATSRLAASSESNVICPSTKYEAQHEISIMDLTLGTPFMYKDSIFVFESLAESEDDPNNIMTFSYSVEDMYYETFKMPKSMKVSIPEFKVKRFIYIGDDNMHCVFVPTYGSKLMFLEMSFVRTFLGTPVKGDFVDLCLYGDELCAKMIFVGDSAESEEK